MAQADGVRCTSHCPCDGQRQPARRSHRPLRPGGRVGVSDVVTEDHLTDAERAERGSYVGCITGALSVAEYRAGLEAAGFTNVSIEFTHGVGDGVHAAIVRAVKPTAP